MHYSSKPLHGSADPRKHTSLFFLCVQRCQSYDAMHHACMHAGVASTYATTFAGWRFNEPFAVKHTLLGASCRVCSWFLLSASYFQKEIGWYWKRKNSVSEDTLGLTTATMRSIRLWYLLPKLSPLGL
ncbi:hypothetical protein BRADI_1g36539v3 [Brachypodium distachyon]|uniref:Uncharacterized protein n=1 Tax=Brachypodium distachyon TaxID=15368 RepID=A0A2K2DN25_BRADI|nr:hypothetical protein BRADI_1g36539v3 [Brachypodium distachyon]